MRTAKLLPVLIFIICTLLYLGCPDDKPCTTCPTAPDTIGHEFIWDSPVFLGDGSSSSLYDVVIINDTLAYACGAIYKKDSAGILESESYNFTKWDGKKWDLIRIWFYTVCGQQSRTAYPTSSIFAFSSTNIWVAMDGDQIAKYNGATQTETMCLPVSFSIKKIWGSNSNNVYVIGYDGTKGVILHYFNGSWQKIESGTNLPLYDIYGATDPKTGGEQILAVGSNNIPFDRIVISLQGNTITKLSSYPIQHEFAGVWFAPNKHYYVVGDGIYEKNSLADTTWKNGPLDITNYTTSKIRANGLNDIFVVGAFGECLHFNGADWKSYRYVTGLSNGGYYGVAIKGNLVIAVGYNSPVAVTILGRRK